MTTSRAVDYLLKSFKAMTGKSVQQLSAATAQCWYKLAQNTTDSDSFKFISFCPSNKKKLAMQKLRVMAYTNQLRSQQTIL
jgi:hypothetical protein